MTFDVKQHVLVPEHVKLSQKEKDELYKKHNITFVALPKIRLKDAALATLDVKEGDVIKIIRKSLTAGTAVFYRGVVNE
ncbi:MAG TPA: DNA-directed RNA polymerase subunit H [Acidobacteriota bacterium]|nr:DNA-directed RNA polymerase subunit H [Acidobacteriota bacterium]